jgi:8-amino-7-oxononanoate synthase
MSPANLQTLESALGAQIVLNGRVYINFGGSSYLGLASNSLIVEAGIAALREFGAGVPIPRAHGVITRAHREFEIESATFFETDTALYLASGYCFGLIGIAALGRKSTRIFFDEWAHHSLREAIAASALASQPFRHLDCQDLEAQLKRHLRRGEAPLVVTDGLFSTLGEIAPLSELERAVAPYGGRLLVDESHSFGVLGPRGRGAYEHHDVPRRSIVIGGSLGKALGVCGGVIPASEDEAAAFRSSPASRGASTGLPAAAAMCSQSLKYVREHPELLERLRANTKYLKCGLRRLGLDVADTVVPIAAFVAGSDRSMQALREALLTDGIFLYHSKYIGAGAAGVIRCSVYADHTVEHMDRLIDALRRLL